MIDIEAHLKSGSWRVLQEYAQALVGEAEARAGAGFSMDPALGGGTRLMIAYQHRISHDIDLFIRDPQWLGFLNTERWDTDLPVFACHEGASASIKFTFEMGEVDFIVARSLLVHPYDRSPESPFCLESVAEVIAKKLYYRGSSMAVRDLFDWWAVAQRDPNVLPSSMIIDLLRSRRIPVIAQLERIMTPTKSIRLEWDSILAPEKPDLAATARWAISELQVLKKRPKTSIYRI